MSFSGSSPADAVPPVTAIQAAARLLADGQVEDALERLRALVRAAPAYPAAQVLLAKACEAAGDWDAALAAWQEAYVLVPSSPLVRRERQRLLDAHARAAEAPYTSAEVQQEPESEAAEAETAIEAGEGAPAAEERLEETSVEPDAEPAAAPEEDRAEPGATETSESGATERFITDESAEPSTIGTDEEVEALPAFDVEEAEVVPPDVDEEADLTRASEDAEAGWQARATEPEAEPEHDGDDTDWAVVEEAEVPSDAETVVEPHVAPPGEAGAPPSEPAEPEVEDARILSESSGENSPDEGPRTLADDLDDLIQQLEEAPRIRPDPAFTGPDVLFDEEIADDMVSETLARIYAAQQQYAQAAVVYEKLAQQKPEQAEALRRKAAEMRAQGGGA